MQQQTTSQTQINQQVAIALERLNGRMENLETWRKDVDDDRRRAEDRKDDRIEKAPENRRADYALLISGAMGAFYLLTFLAQHWKP